jgi:hypothetical protein
MGFNLSVIITITTVENYAMYKRAKKLLDLENPPA